MRGVVLVVVLLAGLAVAACGGGDSAPVAPAASTSTLVPAPTATVAPVVLGPPEIVEYPVPAGSRPHDVAPAVDGGVWYTAQGSGELGWLDPATGETIEIPLGAGSAPHGVIVGPDGAPWITDGGLNAIVRVDPETREVTVYRLPGDRPGANLNTAAFDGRGVLWFTGQAGVYGQLDPATGAMVVYDAPRGRGPYGVTSTPSGEVYYSSLAGSYVARIDIETGAVDVLDPPTAGAGARRAWSDDRGRIWISEWNAGQLAVYDPNDGIWREFPLPGAAPMAYAAAGERAPDPRARGRGVGGGVGGRPPDRVPLRSPVRLEGTEEPGTGVDGSDGAGVR
jgi:virginiamycin B lyase